MDKCIIMNRLLEVFIYTHRGRGWVVSDSVGGSGAYFQIWDDCGKKLLGQADYPAYLDSFSFHFHSITSNRPIHAFQSPTLTIYPLT
jgi:hypothetical protein